MGQIVSNPNDIADGLLKAQHLKKSDLARYTFDRFDAPPRFSDSLGNGPAVGTLDALNLIHTNAGIYEYRNALSTNAIAVPVYDRANGKGLDIARELAFPNKGIEIVFSPVITAANQTRGKHSFKIGTDRPFFARWKLLVTDPVGLRPRIGFRSITEGYTFGTLGNLNVYNYWAVLAGDGGNPIGSYVKILDAGNFFQGNLALTPGVPSSWVVKVDMKGLPSFAFNDVPIPPLNQTKRFIAGDIVAPVLYFEHLAAISESLFIQEFECGFLPTRGE